MMLSYAFAVIGKIPCNREDDNHFEKPDSAYEWAD